LLQDPLEPVWTAASSTRVNSCRSGGGSPGEAGKIHARMVPATTYSPTLGRSRRQAPCLAACTSSAPQPRHPPERDRVREARPSRSPCSPMESLPETGMGCADDQGPPNADPATALPADWRALPDRRSRPKHFLAPGAQACVVTAGQATHRLRRQTDTSSQNSRTG
jgi:hypothetical protein